MGAVLALPEPSAGVARRHGLLEALQQRLQPRLKELPHFQLDALLHTLAEAPRLALQPAFADSLAAAALAAAPGLPPASIVAVLVCFAKIERKPSRAVVQGLVRELVPRLQSPSTEERYSIQEAAEALQVLDCPVPTEWNQYLSQ